MFDSIAKKVYGDETLCSKIIQSNPEKISTIIFSVGIILEVQELPEPELIYNTLPPWRKKNANTPGAG
jgi:hypothetical protein